VITSRRSPEAHLAALRGALDDLEGELDRIDAWGRELARRLVGGARLLTLGNGGSAAEAQHLSAELVGRYVDERMPLSAIALCTDSSAMTAIVNDYGIPEMFARQVRAHGRPGDVLMAFSTSGRSPNVVAGAATARELGLTVWGLTGPDECPLAELCDDALAATGTTTATIQEIHLLVVHLLCASVDRAVAALPDSAWAPTEVVG
jgi:D-sedoheptulose 7-phosphate isomerase